MFYHLSDYLLDTNIRIRILEKVQSLMMMKRIMMMMMMKIKVRWNR